MRDGVCEVSNSTQIANWDDFIDQKKYFILQKPQLTFYSVETCQALQKELPTNRTKAANLKQCLSFNIQITWQILYGHCLTGTAWIQTGGTYI